MSFEDNFKKAIRAAGGLKTSRGGHRVLSTKKEFQISGMSGTFSAQEVHDMAVQGYIKPSQASPLAGAGHGNARSELVAEAARQMAAYAQYRDHWRDYVTGVMRKDVRTKLGQAFRKGETVLVNPTPGPHQTPGFLTAWSMSNKVDTSVRANDVEIAGASGGSVPEQHRRRIEAENARMPVPMAAVMGGGRTRKPTIYEALREKLGREPTDAELKVDVQRIKQEALVTTATAGRLPHQRRRT